MSTSNFTTPKSITQNVVMADFLEESQNNQNSTEAKFSGNTHDYYQWLQQQANCYTKPNILDIFSSEDPGTSSFLRQLGHSVQVTDADRDNLDFLNNLPGSDIENPAKFFDLLTDDITKQYDIVIWHNPQVEVKPEDLITCLSKVSSCLITSGILITDIQFSPDLINQFDSTLALQPNLSFDKVSPSRATTCHIFKKQ